MKLLAIPAIVLGLTAVACGGSGSSYSTTSPSGSTSSASTSFTMQLSAQNETPPVTNAESTVTGSATISFHLTKDGSGNVTAATADFQLNASGFPAGSQVTMAHIHLGGAGTPGAILVDTGLAPGGVTVSGGSVSFSRTGVNVSPDIAQAMTTSPGNYYFNIHTALNPNGVARGQLDNGSGGTPAPNPNPYP
jgi:hypothetical protein